MIGYVKTLSNSTTKVKYQKKLEQLSKTDELSNLSNRRELLDKGALWLSNEEKSNVALLFFDIDFFKNINDTFGHVVGDEVIRYIGLLLRKRFRSNDVVTRYGGEEFIAMIHINDQNEAIKLAWRILKDVQDFSFIKSAPHFKLTISAGVAFANTNEDIETLVKKADKAMYKAKENGRNQVVVYEA